MTWENHGVAPAYHHFKLFVKLVAENKDGEFMQELSGSDNRTWMPGDIIAEQYPLQIDKNLKGGKYDLLISMRDDCGFHNKPVDLAIKKEREKEPGWYKLGEVIVK